MDVYQQFIAKSKYARFLDDKQRREHWPETVSRYIQYMKNKCGEKISENTYEELETAILNLEVLPSMRLLMTAGPACDKSNVGSYNCAYTAIDDPKAFDEIMYVLMCGTGVGFSVEEKHVKKLPDIPDTLFNSDTKIVVSDSKEGWAKAFRQLIALLYSGEIPKWDISKVRPKGARLKTFGGRASGPAPLVSLFEFTVNIFKNAVGRKLNSLECHDIVCKVADIVIVGSVRRSALISLSDLNDERLRKAKTGEWWTLNGHRALANNSANYREKPEIGQFMQEWLSLYESKSGERGIFNSTAIKTQVEKFEKRQYSEHMGTNPCSEIILNPNQFCNLSTIVVRPEDTRETIKNKIRLAAILGTYQSSLTYFPYLRKSWTSITREECLLGVSMTGILDNAFLSDYSNPELHSFLSELRQLTVDTNKEFANKLGINPSKAVTCCKPEGTSSQLCNTSSGLHGQHSRYYLRSIRSDNKDPITKALKDAGVMNEPCVMKPDDTTIFYFPKKASEFSVLRDDLSAVEQLELWLTYQRYYCEHKPSITITVKEHEWLDVAAWVYNMWDEMTGVSFLPHSDHVYKQAPYQEITEEEYLEYLEKTPKEINWDSLVENTDNVEGVQTLACTSGHCEI